MLRFNSDMPELREIIEQNMPIPIGQKDLLLFNNPIEIPFISEYMPEFDGLPEVLEMPEFIHELFSTSILTKYKLYETA